MSNTCPPFILLVAGPFLAGKDAEMPSAEMPPGYLSR